LKLAARTPGSVLISLIIGALTTGCGITKPAQQLPPSDAARDTATSADAIDSPTKGGADGAEASGDEVSDEPDADAAEASEAGCIGEGEAVETFVSGGDCCPGLQVIRSGDSASAQFTGQTDCHSGIDGRVCSRCGNGVCEPWELPCGCPADCGDFGAGDAVDGGPDAGDAGLDAVDASDAGISCGPMTCPSGTYCLELSPDAGTPSSSCVVMATDCSGGEFCSCRTARLCLEGCDPAHLTVTCRGD